MLTYLLEGECCRVFKTCIGFVSLTDCLLLLSARGLVSCDSAFEIDEEPFVGRRKAKFLSEVLF